MTLKLKPFKCINCGELMNAVDAVEEGVPAPTDGCIALCIHCNHIYVFQGGRLRNSTEAERDEAAGHPGIMEAIQFNRAYQKMFPRTKDT